MVRNMCIFKVGDSLIYKFTLGPKVHFSGVNINLNHQDVDKILIQAGCQT